MITETLNNLLHQTAFFNLDWGNYVMIAVACFFLYLAIKHEFEPLLLVPIAFGMLLVNIYPDIMAEPYTDEADRTQTHPLILAQRLRSRKMMRKVKNRARRPCVSWTCIRLYFEV